MVEQLVKTATFVAATASVVAAFVSIFNLWLTHQERTTQRRDSFVDRLGKLIARVDITLDVLSRSRMLLTAMDKKRSTFGQEMLFEVMKAHTELLKRRASIENGELQKVVDRRLSPTPAHRCELAIHEEWVASISTWAQTSESLISTQRSELFEPGVKCDGTGFSDSPTPPTGFSD